MNFQPWSDPTNTYFNSSVNTYMWLFSIMQFWVLNSIAYGNYADFLIDFS